MVKANITYLNPSFFMSEVSKIKKILVIWLSQRTGVVLLIAIIGGLVPAFGFVSMAVAQDLARVEVESYNNFGRVVINFEDRYSLPAYTLESENGILIVKFNEEVNFNLPEIEQIIPKFISASRIDPDRRAIRFALKGDFKINKTEAGERLYIDIMPSNWQGLLPSLPTEIVEELSKRAQNALLLAQKKQKEELILKNKPSVEVKVGRHPSFIRLIVNWSVDVDARHSLLDQVIELKFDWPVAIDLTQIKSDLPDEIISIDNKIDKIDSIIIIKLKEQVVSRYYATSERQYIIDIDLNNVAGEGADIASLLPESIEQVTNEQLLTDLSMVKGNEDTKLDIENDKKITIIPLVEQVGSTIRMTFPFESETAAAVFRRGDTLWMVFDTNASIGEPEKTKEFSSIAKEFSVVGAGQTSIIRINLSTDRLATLGSEGRAWVLSLGDVLLDPIELISLKRRQTRESLFEIVADLERPSKVHQLRDPIVGDLLEVVTSFPPARGIARELSMVEFNALRSVHGLVIKPLHDNIIVAIEDKNVIIRADKGLIVSTSKGARTASEAWQDSEDRNGFIDLIPLVEEEPQRFFEQQRQIIQRIVDAEHNAVGAIRLQLAQYFLANQHYYEALGILNLIDKELAFGDLGVELNITRAAATLMAYRNEEALALLNKKAIEDDVDAMIWRTIARVRQREFSIAISDALASETIIDDYPKWVKTEFLLASTTAAIEINDIANATRFIVMIDTDNQSVETINKYRILLARIDEAEGRFDKALETLGQVIAADNRPTRASAVYYTIALLKRMKKLDSIKGANTLALEEIIWRGGDIEVKMMGLLGDLYFESGSFREAFSVSEQMLKTHPKSEEALELLEKSQQAFANLFLNGEAEQLPPIKALSLYYDFRHLTPVGARGDEMIRSLARRLVKVDLLEQAAELLQYQVDERLQGVARAQISADLAVIYLADRKPERAIEVIYDSRLVGIPQSLQRQRRILEVKALIDVGRAELALDILSNMQGKDADLLKVDAHWSANRYLQAAEIIEQLYESEMLNSTLSTSAKANIIKAGVGYVLAGDRIGLTRLRLKYGEQMSASSEWGLFDFVTAQVNATSLEFKKVMQEIANTNSLAAFLNAYNESYGPEGALTPIKLK